jgi:hypothetical protein
MRRRRLIRAVVLAGVIAGATPWFALDAQGAGGRGGRRGPPPRPNVQEKAFEWSGELTKGQRVIVRSLHGNIRVEPSTGKTLDIVANKVWRRGRPETVKIEATRINEGRDVLVCARWPGTTTCAESEYSHSSDGEVDANDIGVEFTIMLPAGTNAALHTTLGDITVNGASGDLRATTTLGRIRLETSASVYRAETTTGDVRVQMAKLPAKEGRYAAVTGGVSVTLPDGINANIDARTALGAVTTDFAIAIEGEFSSKQVRGTIGKGGPRLVLESVNGGVRILKQ